MRRFCVFLIIFVGGIAFSQEKIQYFDQNWKPTTKDRAKFYRPLPLKKFGTLELLQDYYYPSGKLQFQAYIKNGDERDLVGDAVWFQEYGDSHRDIYINKTAQKKLSYYFEDGKLWKTIEYGDSLKNGKTIEYKPDGSILGEGNYINGTLVSGTADEDFDDNYYNRYNPKTKEKEFVSIPRYTGTSNFVRKFYYRNSLKDAVEFKVKNGQTIEETLYAEDGSIIQKLDSLSYYQSTDELKNGRDYHYSPIRSAITNLDSYTEYQSFPFSEVKFRNLAYILLYRGEMHFIEKNPSKNLFRETDYEIFEDRGQKFVRLEWESGRSESWKELKEFQDPETQLIAITEISSLNKNDLYEKLKRKSLANPDLLKKGIREEITFASPEKSVKTVSYPGKNETENDSKLIWAEVKSGAYIMIRELGGYFIPQKSSDILFIPNFTTK